jgi:hypothetical protein
MTSDGATQAFQDSVDRHKFNDLVKRRKYRDAKELLEKGLDSAGVSLPGHHVWLDKADELGSALYKDGSYSDAAMVHEKNLKIKGTNSRQGQRQNLEHSACSCKGSPQGQTVRRSMRFEPTKH